ncbi:copper homeostasis protein cutC homolog isoform X2 [Galleria mellonella]|uniref:Copper homeostasis protein cutC homolog n=1 Tax=Galleria mellonella TaxID=7137 RepID=A0ABM3MRS7_GALME|nr:copper homeostasis protein cutC homolog isoform X2 [Galleria mellonella]
MKRAYNKHSYSGKKVNAKRSRAAFLRHHGTATTMLEVCVDSLQSAINAIHGGADELEICSSLNEGGLTPSVGLVKKIKHIVNNIPMKKPIYKTCVESCSCLKLLQKPNLNIMIRCRTGSDFCYTDEEVDTMLEDIEVFKEIGVDRFVFGALTNTLKVDEENCVKVLNLATPIPVTFHRAIDICQDYISSVNTIIELGFNRVLTSGQKAMAADTDALNMIKLLVEMYGDKIEVMPGAGVNGDNAKIFIDLGCKIVHSSCKNIRYLCKLENNLNMGTSDSEFIYVSDENIVRMIKTVINS